MLEIWFCCGFRPILCACLKVNLGADILADREEPVSRMEPMLLSDRSKSRDGLYDLALELTAKSAGFSRSLPPAILASLADLVRSRSTSWGKGAAVQCSRTSGSALHASPSDKLLSLD